MTEGTGRVIRRDGITSGKKNHNPPVKWHRERSVPGTTLCGNYIKPGLIMVAPLQLELEIAVLCIKCFDLPAISESHGVEIKGKYYFRMKTTRKSQVPKWHIAVHTDTNSLRKGKHKGVCNTVLPNFDDTVTFRLTPPPYHTMCKNCTHPKRGPKNATEETP